MVYRSGGVYGESPRCAAGRAVADRVGRECHTRAEAEPLATSAAMIGVAAEHDPCNREGSEMFDTIMGAGSLPLVVAGLLLAGLGLPIPEDPLLLAAGVVAHRGPWAWWSVLPLAYGCVIGADCSVFLMARHFGARILKRAPFRWLVTRNRQKRVSVLFERYGRHAVFVGRHMSGARTLVFMLAGIEKMPFFRFLLWDGLAGLVSVPAVFGLGYLFSAHVEAVRTGLARIEHWVAAALALIAIIAWSVWTHRAPMGSVRSNGLRGVEAPHGGSTETPREGSQP